MPLILTEQALDWALEHILNYGDTDIFPEAFEFEAIKHSWQDVKASIASVDILKWNIRPYRRCLAPKNRFGFRISTQLDPLDILVYTALIYEVGGLLESSRVSTGESIVHSYRFDPKPDGRMFSAQFNYQSFQEKSRQICDSDMPTHVVIADIADFFPRLYTHRIDNALLSVLGSGHMHAVAIKRLLGHWAGSYSYGIPVGSAASRMVAETAIGDIDQLLLSEGACYLRFADDFRFFCQSEAEAYRYLALIARVLIENHGLTLQQSKTRIVPIDQFRQVYLREYEAREVETLSHQFYSLLAQIGIRDIYETIDYTNLSPSNRELVNQLNLRQLLSDQLSSEEPDLSMLRFLLRRMSQLDDAGAVDLVINNIGRLAPVAREAIQFLVKLSTLTGSAKQEAGMRLLEVYSDKNVSISHIEYGRMYLLRPFALQPTWHSSNGLVQLYNESIDDFSRREFLLAMGQAHLDFWFRARKQSFQEMTPWIRRTFIRAASCLPPDEYKHWIRGIQGQLDQTERAIANWSKVSPIA
jgi:hypothetical protein